MKRQPPSPMAVSPFLLRVPLQRRLDDLLDPRRDARWIGMQSLHQQGAVIDLLDDDGLQLGARIKFQQVLQDEMRRISQCTLGA
jgi:hypothetical protein